ncbi:HAD family phosphatase [Mesorhizobium sp. CAU 1732]|uniref:HAD family hydrolase n=1 Tax=Mesorhizobium sp. CAU 1732 TaxID=3140358 RepID=UPI003261B7EB
MTNPVVGAIFDMDGLLIDTEKLSQASYRYAREWAGLPPDDELFFSVVGLNSRAGHERLVAGISHLTDYDRFSAVWRETFDASLAAEVPVKPHVRDVLESLSSRGIPMAVATSTNASSAHDRLSRAGLRKHFPVLIGGDQIENGKPAPDIYLKAAATLGLAPSLCAGFEDSANGVRAAVAAGLVTVQVPDLIHPTPELLALGHRVASDLAEAMRLVGLMPHAELVPSL